MEAVNRENAKDPFYGTGARDPRITPKSISSEYEDEKYGYIPGIDNNAFYGKNWFQKTKNGISEVVESIPNCVLMILILLRLIGISVCVEEAVFKKRSQYVWAFFAFFLPVIAIVCINNVRKKGEWKSV
jgi:hypothetical protein